MTTIATWNLHHMGNHRAIKEGTLEVIAKVRPDVLVLTEYVDRDNRTDFRAGLRSLEYLEPMVSPQGKGQNQVLVASRDAQEDGGLEAPDVDDAARTNFLHRRIPRLGLGVVGFRVPYYQGEMPVQPEKLVDYWGQFKRMALGEADRTVVFIGDFNIGKDDVDEPGRKAVASLVGKGFRLVGEVGGLDRALLTPEIQLKSFSVLYEVAGMPLTGKGGLSDHPMLIVEIA